MQSYHLKKILEDINQTGEITIIDENQNNCFEIIEIRTCEDKTSEDYRNYADLVIDLSKFTEPLKEEQKARNKKIEAILKTLENRMKSVIDFSYCKKGNENYLNDIIKILIASETQYLKTLKDEITRL